MDCNGVATVYKQAEDMTGLFWPLSVAAHLGGSHRQTGRNQRSSVFYLNWGLPMSIKIMNAVWGETSTSGSKRLVLLALADNANDDGFCWPSLETIAVKCNLTRRYVIDIIKELEECGLLEKKIRAGTSTMYKLLVNPGSLGSEAGFTSGSEAGFTALVNQGSLKPSINHHYEPPLNNIKEGPESLKELAERFTGLLATPSDVKVISEWEKLGVIGDDICEALQWRTDNDQKPVKTIGQLSQGVKLNRSKRIQKQSGKKPATGPTVDELYPVFTASEAQ